MTYTIDQCIAENERLSAELAALKGRRCEGCDRDECLTEDWSDSGEAIETFACNRWTARAEEYERVYPDDIQTQGGPCVDDIPARAEEGSE